MMLIHDKIVQELELDGSYARVLLRYSETRRFHVGMQCLESFYSLHGLTKTKVKVWKNINILRLSAVANLPIRYMSGQIANVDCSLMQEA